jgi:hypothetical protein
MKLDIGPTWDALDEMRRERNLIAHGVWTMRFGGDSQGETAMPPEGLPMVLWHSKMLESDDFVTAESFHFWRFDKFMDRARVLTSLLRSLLTSRRHNLTVRLLNFIHNQPKLLGPRRDNLIEISINATFLT